MDLNQIRRREFLRQCGLGACAAALPGAARAAALAPRPNIILFMVDDMGWQDTSLPFLYANGKPVKTALNRRYRTPHMEAMARDGMMFTHAYACPVCSPTRCSLLSGMNMARHRITDWTLGVDQPDRLKSAGEGLRPPRWGVNGLQPENTAAAGTCAPPWTLDAAGKYARPPAGSARARYEMRDPFTNALAFPKLLREAGYFTIHCGKAHWGSGSGVYAGANAPTTPGADPCNFGFDVNIAGSEIGAPARYRGDKQYGNANRERFAVPGMDENNYYSENAFLTDALTDRALKTIAAERKTNPNRPFFLYMAHYALHAPWADDRAWDCSRSASEDLAADSKNPNPKDGMVWNKVERNYSVLIKGMDDSLGAIRKFLADNNLADNTIVIFMSDNGGHDGSSGTRMKNANAPLRGGKGSCYEGGIREPMMVVWPGRVKPGAVSHEPVHIDDFYPTILDMARVPPPRTERLATTPAAVYGDGELRQRLDGQSIVPVLEGSRRTVNADGSERTLLWHYPNRWGEGHDARYFNFYTAVRRGKWKLIYNHTTAGGAKTFELYDLSKDVAEERNLAAERPDVVKCLRREMARLLRERRAQMPFRQTDGAEVALP